MKVEHITPLLIVDTIEPLLPMWRDSLGYKVVAEVGEDPSSDNPSQPLGFVILSRDDQTLMLQSKASIEKDIPAVGKLGVTSLLYINVDNLDAHMTAMGDATLLVGPRTTFYGAKEAFFVTRSGHVVAFAEHAAG